MNINNVFVKPLLTEKSIDKTAKSVYSFQVKNDANKNQIKSAAEKLFNVKVASVRTHIKKGKVKRVGQKMKPKKRSDVKIALIKLTSGKIDLFPMTNK